MSPEEEVRKYPSRKIRATIVGAPKTPRGKPVVMRIDIIEDSHDHKVYCTAYPEKGDTFQFMLTKKELDTIEKLHELMPDYIKFEPLMETPPS